MNVLEHSPTKDSQTAADRADRAEWLPHHKHELLFVVMPADFAESGLDLPIQQRVAATKAYFEREQAEADVRRLNELNAGKACHYFWSVARLSRGQAEDGPIGEPRRKLSRQEKARLKQLQQQIADELPELTEQHRQLTKAAAENTFSGRLREAIHRSRILLPDVARRSGLSMEQIHEFLLGERTLSSSEVDRLIDVLGYTLRPIGPCGKQQS